MSEVTETKETKNLDLVKWAFSVVLVALAIFGNAYFDDEPFLYRLIAVLIVAITAGLVASTTNKGTAFRQLLVEARTEMRRVVWPTRNETFQTSIIVLVCVMVVALLLWVMDLGLGATISILIG